MTDEPTRYQPVMPGSPDHTDRSMPAEVSVGGAAGADTRRERLRAAAAARGVPLATILTAVAVVAVTFLAGKLIYRLRDVLLLMATLVAYSGSMRRGRVRGVPGGWSGAGRGGCRSSRRAAGGG